MSMPSMLGIFGAAVAFDMFEDMFGIFMEPVVIAAMAEETAVIVMAVAIVMDSIESISRGQEEENKNEKNGGTGSRKETVYQDFVGLSWVNRKANLPREDEDEDEERKKKKLVDSRKEESTCLPSFLCSTRMTAASLVPDEHISTPRYKQSKFERISYTPHFAPNGTPSL